MEGHFVNWMTISNREKSVVEDVSRIRNHPLVDPEVPIYGYIPDLATGAMQPVPEANAIGRPQ